MKLNLNAVTAWPKLAWVARFTPLIDTVAVFHGPYVEANDQWCVEAVWAGDYTHGDFDKTDLIFGSGIRCRENHVVFVSSGTTLDRLWHYRRGDTWYVANSFPALLATADLSLDALPTSCVRNIDSIMRGIADYERLMPCDDGDLSIVYFNNLLWDGKALSEVDKVDTAPTFDCYETYSNYLLKSADTLAENMYDCRRSNRITPMVTVSKGYDSSAAAVIARHVGCKQAVTLKQSTSIWRGSDSGEEVALALGLECATYNRTAHHYPQEETIWSVSGRAGILNWTLFDYPEPLSLFFTAPYGDKMWSRTRWSRRDPFVFTGLSLGGLGEFRLFKGIFHCPLPFWGMRHLEELWDITASEEMKPWSIEGDYDRPIPRRLVEEAGVPRAAFGQRKKNTSHDEALLWPYTPEAVASFQRFLIAQGVPTSGRALMWLRRHGANIAHLIEANLPRSLTQSVRRRRKEAMSTSAELLFRWSNSELSQTYRAAFVESLPNFTGAAEPQDAVEK